MKIIYTKDKEKENYANCSGYPYLLGEKKRDWF